MRPSPACGRKRRVPAKPLPLLLISLLIPALATCDSPGGVGPEDTAIGPEGGTVSLAHGRATLSIPEGILFSRVRFTGALTSGGPASHLLVDGSAVELGPVGTVFSVPVTLSLAYDASNLPPGVQEEELALHEAAEGGWEMAAAPSLDMQAHKASGAIRHLGRFAVLGLPVASVAVFPPSPTLLPGGSVRFTATARAEDGTALVSRPVHWSTSDQSVVTVDPSGIATAIAPGSATVTARSEEAENTAAVTVSVPVASVDVSPRDGTVEVRGTLRLVATPRDGSGTALDRPVTWSSSDEAVATVDEDGLVAGISEGNVSISAASEGVTGTVTVTSRDPVRSVEVTPPSATVLVWETAQFTATVRGASGAVLEDRAIAWDSDDAAVATVSESGQVRGFAEGAATVTATTEGKSASAALRVIPVLTVTTSSLPGGTVGAPYTQSLAATGGEGHYTWSLPAGALPPGITLSPQGSLAGTPTADGVYSPTFQVRSGDQTASVSLSITVAMRPQTLVLFATPKMISDFNRPEADVDAFFENYGPLTSQAYETIVVFGVGNSQHILQYRGRDYWSDAVEWARHTGFRQPVSNRSMDYFQIDEIVRAMRRRAASAGIVLKVFDQIDQGREFAYTDWKDHRHPECLDPAYEDAFDIRQRLRADDSRYASAPNGIQAGTLCGEFLADQVTHYVHDLGFDGILYGNQLGTRGHWVAEFGPGYSVEEANAIRSFLAYSRQVLGNKELMWFDSYNNVDVELNTWSFPRDGYRFFEYLIAAGFCVITDTAKYIDNLESKLLLPDPTRILASLDYVDPWYEYNSMIEFPDESARLEEVAVRYRNRIDGIVFFANDEDGGLVPRGRIASFARRFFKAGSR